MARKTTIMNVNVDDDEVNLVRDARARSNACYKCGEMGHFQRDCQYDGDKPSSDKQPLQTTSDTYDPVVGKWMTNLVATTPVTAKAMQNLLLELHKQRELKRAYRRRYKDIQTTSTSTSTISQPLTSIASTSKSTTPVKTTGSQVKRPLGKGKLAKPIDKSKKCVAFSTTSTPTATTSTSTVSLPSLRNKLRG